MTLPDNGTTLVISGIGIPKWSARGLSETLEPIDQALNNRRDINGELDDWSYDQFRKYRLKIVCEDMRPIGLSGIWPGQMVTVDCVTELCYAADDSSMPHREAVEDSTRLENGFYFFRPRLEMRVESFQLEKDEYGAVVGWSLDLEEI